MLKKHEEEHKVKKNKKQKKNKLLAYIFFLEMDSNLTKKLMAMQNILQKHHIPSCKLCQEIPVANIMEYIRHCFLHFRMKTLRCADIVLLHEYTKNSGGTLPESQINLRHFWYTGKIPCANLEHLQSCSALCDTVCDICCLKLLKGSDVYKLECGHVFHVVPLSSTLSTCNLLAWLSRTDVCPKCDAKVCISIT